MNVMSYKLDRMWNVNCKIGKLSILLYYDYFVDPSVEIKKMLI